MYTYKGSNPESQEKIRKIFDDEHEAIEFARDNAYEYPSYTVKDEEGELVDSDKLAEEQEDATRDSMFPDEDSMEEFDVDRFFGNE